MIRLKKIIRVVLKALASIAGFLILLLIFLNLSFTEQFVTRQVNHLFNKLELPININSIKTIGLKSVSLEGVRINDLNGDAIIYVGKLESGIHLLALLRTRVELYDVYIDRATVGLNNSLDTRRLNIAETFSPIPKPDSIKALKGKTTWEIMIRNGELLSVDFQMTDSISGLSIFQEIDGIRLGDFTVSLLNSALLADTIELRRGTGSITLAPSSERNKNKKGSPWNFGLQYLSMKDIDFNYHNSIDSLMLNVILDKGMIRTNHMDILNKAIDIDEISIEGASANILTGTRTNKPKEVQKHAGNNFLWDLKTHEIDLKNAALRLGSYAVPSAISPEIKIGFSGLGMNLANFHINNDSTGAALNSLHFDLDNGFSMETMTGLLDSDSNNTQFKLALETGYSRFHMDGAADGAFLDLITDLTGIQKAQIIIRNTSISLNDISPFYADVGDIPVYILLTTTPTTIAAQIDMEESALLFSGFSISNVQNFKMLLDGIIEKPFQPSIARGNIDLSISEVNMSWLKELLSGYGIENKIPESTLLSLEANISDSFISPDLQLQLSSNQGKIELSGTLDYSTESYYLNADFDSLNLGEILGIPEIGLFYGSGEITGGGFNSETNQSNISLRVNSFRFNDYDYTQTHIDGMLRQGSYEFNLHSNDPSLKGELYIDLQHAGSIFEASAKGSIFAQLNKLHFYKDTLALESSLEANFHMARNTLEADLSLAGMKIMTPWDSAEVTQIDAYFLTDSIRTSLSGTSDFFDIDLQIGKPIDKLETLGEDYRQYLASFIDPEQMHSSTRVSDLPEINLTGKVAHHKSMGLFLNDPDFHITHLDFSLLNHSSDNRMIYGIIGSGIKYKRASAENLNAILIDSAGVLNLEIIADSSSLFSDPVNTIQLKGQFAQRRSLTEFSVFDTLDNIMYNFEISSEHDSNQIVLNNPSQQFIINQEIWQMDSPELLSFDMNSQSILPGLKMYTDSSFLHIGTLNKDGMRGYQIDLEQVDLASLIPKNLIPGRSGGFISGTINYGTTGGLQRKLTSDLNLSDVRFSELNFNEVTFKSDIVLSDSGDYTIDILARLDSSHIDLKAEKAAVGTRTINAEFSHIPMNTVQPFTSDYLSAMKGSISGDFNISSLENAENYSGELRFHGASLKINPLNASYKIPDQRILFSNNRMVFTEFRVLDSLDKALLVDGYVDFTNNQPITADLNISSTKLQVMNRSGEEDVSFYGDIFVDSEFYVEGPVMNPSIDGRILLSSGTKIFYRQKEDLRLSETEEIVSFVYYAEDHEQKTEPPVVRKSTFSESSIETIVEIDPATQLNFNVSNRIYNVELTIMGGGFLNYNMLNNNQVTLSGQYDISEGSAYMKLVGWPNKAFRISEGGFIRWDGNVENPELKFEATNKVASSYLNPLDGSYRDVDFNVILQLSNHLSDLDILLTISTNDQYLMSIINTLSPEEQMRQAITILLFEIVDLPGISTSSDYMTQQVNQILASQLNQLTEATIKGIDISFGIDTYTQTTQSGGEETSSSLSYEVRKSLLNNRAQIELSGRLYDVNQNPGSEDVSLNNIKFEYRLDSAATKYLKVYNEHTYEDVFEGEVIKTGVGLTYRKRYRSLKDIWKRGKKDKKNR